MGFNPGSDRTSFPTIFRATVRRLPFKRKKRFPGAGGAGRLLRSSPLGHAPAQQFRQKDVGSRVGLHNSPINKHQLGTSNIHLRLCLCDYCKSIVVRLVPRLLERNKFRCYILNPLRDDLPIKTSCPPAFGTKSA